MNKIRFTANKDTNYVFHMLSVSKCGYDNAYGEKYKKFYPMQDLQILTDNKELLTVCGGSHLGALYGLMVCESACGYVSAKEYYNELLGQIETNGLEEQFFAYTEVIKAVSEVMIKHYDYYIDNIWPMEQERINAYIPQLEEYFRNSEFTETAEKLVGCKLPNDFFTVTFVSSVENGAEAIDISKEQDLFGIERSLMDAVYFIGHEFIIYLLFEALKNEDAFRGFDTWSKTEGLAEFYLKKIMGDTRFFNEQQKYVEFYERCEGDNTLSAVELYRETLNESVFPEIC